MATLQEILARSQHGDPMSLIARAYDLTPEQTESAVAALLPAISMGLKRSTATPEGLGELFDVAGRQPSLYAMYEDPEVALSPEGVAAGSAVMSNLFGSPEATRAVAAHAQQLSGIGGAILEKILPVLVGMLLSGLMRGGSGQAAPAPQQPAPQQPAPRQQSPGPGGGGIFDIFREIFQQGGASSAPYQPGQSPVPPIGDILDSIGDGRHATAEAGPPKFPVPDAAPEMPRTNPQSHPVPKPPVSGGDQTFPSGSGAPDGDIFGQILKELGKAVQEGRVKPVIVGPGDSGFPGQQTPSGRGQAQPQGGGIFGQILKEVLGGALGQRASARQSLLAPAEGAGAMVFGDGLEHGTNLADHHAESLEEIFGRFGAVPPQAD
ncbi:MAG: DUF937 domain-containing protein [Methyloceanibacter sp.]|jgi:hypothetical protein|uniref:DUF937 domain-containing protein n=1 Tax=Methyloceanibacter sp. TaxID=1965321 RepID=UPI003C53513F